ncbi:gaba permease [Purpureocillium lilacinum]|uniref:Gaba permease n=1 Tax=Purpureocillium lilacinum TaxID=33203 RepID=A0A2U3E730_PURLI|nr:gaba permease [Purpureocillium lilacinum]
MSHIAEGGSATLDNPFGHKQELKKKFGFFSMLGVSFVIIGTWTTIGSSMNIALPSGGPVAMMYGLVVAGIGTLAAAMSLAELASIYPTNGAQYEWTAALASPKYQRPVSYVCGWVVTASWWALAAVGPSLLATLVIALIQLLNEGYVFRKWHQFLVFSATEITAGLINAFGTPLLPLLGKGACWNDGTAWLLGLLQGGLSFTAFDAVAHLVEEMPHPRRDCPRTMVLSIVLGLITGLIFQICVLFSVQDIDEIISSSFGPFVVILEQATKSKGAAAGMTCVLIIIIYCSIAEVVTSSSRLTAAFARQGGVPFSSTFAHVNKRLDLPLNSMLLTNSMVIMFGLIYLGASSAFNAIVSSCVVGLNISYLIPILVLMARGRAILPRGEFSLGRWGYPVNITACLFLTFTIILFLLPSNPHPAAVDMNYAVVAVGIVLIFATVYWCVYGHRFYETPTIHIVDLVLDDGLVKTDRQLDETKHEPATNTI